MVKIPEDGTFDFSGYDNRTSCDKNHNEGTTVRSGVYVTPYTEVMLRFLNYNWLDLEGTHKLCLNDGSLENSGYIDTGSSIVKESEQFVKDNYCHKSHRMGIDVDITSTAAACTENLLNGTMSYKNETMNKREVFTIISEGIGAYIPADSPYHLRFRR